MSLTIATFNSPHRLRPHAKDFQALADRGVAVICAQENADVDPPKNCPRGWRFYRPSRAQSNAVYWDPKVVTRRKAGTKRLSTPGYRSLRYGVWVAFATSIGRMRVMGIHLPAFYADSPKNAREYDAQALLLADWVAKGKRRVVAGDFNGQSGNKRMKPLDAVLTFSDKVPTGPHGQPIDYVGVAEAGPFTVVNTTRVEATNSDHAAVLVEIVKS